MKTKTTAILGGATVIAVGAVVAKRNARKKRLSEADQPEMSPGEMVDEAKTIEGDIPAPEQVDAGIE